MQVKIAIRFHRAEITYFNIYRLYAYKLYAYIFYKLAKNYDFLNSNVTLIEFEHWHKRILQPNCKYQNLVEILQPDCKYHC